MGNYLLSPFKKNEEKNKNINENDENKIKENRRIILQNDNSIYLNLNDLTNLGDTNYYNLNKEKTDINIKKIKKTKKVNYYSKMRRRVL